MKADRRARLRRALCGGLLVAGAALLADSCWIEPYRIEVTRHETGAGPRVVTILHLSDLHMRSFGRRERRVIEILNEVRPDLIAISGDIVSPSSDEADVVAFLRELRAPLGVFACPGNHEEWRPETIAWISSAGVRLLCGETADVGGLRIVGMDDPDRWPGGSATNRPRVVLSHYPTALPTAATAGADLVLAGHTHGGQVRLPFVGALWLPPGSGDYLEGWYEEGATRMYVSRGVGMSILPVRFLCRPEVAVIRFHCEEAP